MITWHQPDQLTLVSRPSTSAAVLALGPALPWTSIYVLTQTLHNFFKSSKITWIGQRPGHGAQDRIELDGHVAAPGPMTHPWTKFTKLKTQNLWRFPTFFFLHQNQIRKRKIWAKTKIITKGPSEGFTWTLRNLLSVAKNFVFALTRFYNACSETCERGDA